MSAPQVREHIPEAARGERLLPREQGGSVGRLIDLGIAIENQVPAHGLSALPVILASRTYKLVRQQGLGEPDGHFAYLIDYTSTLEHRISGLR